MNFIQMIPKKRRRNSSRYTNSGMYFNVWIFWMGDDFIFRVQMWDCAIWLESQILPYSKSSNDFQQTEFIFIHFLLFSSFFRVSFLVSTFANCIKYSTTLHWLLISNMIQNYNRLDEWKYDLKTLMNAITGNYLEMSLLLYDHAISLSTLSKWIPKDIPLNQLNNREQENN